MLSILVCVCYLVCVAISFFLINSDLLSLWITPKFKKKWRNLKFQTLSICGNCLHNSHSYSNGSPDYYDSLSKQKLILQITNFMNSIFFNFMFQTIHKKERQGNCIIGSTKRIGSSFEKKQEQKIKKKVERYGQ